MQLRGVGETQSAEEGLSGVYHCGFVVVDGFGGVPHDSFAGIDYSVGLADEGGRVLVGTCFDTGGPPQVLDIGTSKVDVRVALVDSLATRVANAVYRSVHLGGLALAQPVAGDPN